VPVAHGRNHPTKSQAIHDLEVARVFIYKALDIIYGIGAAWARLGEPGLGSVLVGWRRPASHGCCLRARASPARMGDACLAGAHG